MKYARRFWPVLVLIPALFATTQIMSVVVGVDNPISPFPSAFYNLSWMLKLASIPCIPLLFFFMGERIAEHESRWMTASVVWIVVGLVLVLSVAVAHETLEDLVNTAAFARLWPGVDVAAEVDGDEGLMARFGANWTVSAILWRELVAVVAVAVLVGLTLRASARDLIDAALVAPPVVAIVTLGTYTQFAPWALAVDYDFFVGDAVLGSATAELAFFFAPFDPVGATAVGIATLTMGGLLAAWGGAMSEDAEVRRINWRQTRSNSRTANSELGR